MSERKYKALYGCRNDNCAAEVSWPEFDLMEHPDGGPICDPCWEAEMYEHCAEDSEPPKLKKWVSPETEDRAQLQEKVRVLREAAEAMRKDLLMRAESDSKGVKVVACGSTVWRQFKEAIQATAQEDK